MSIVSEVEFLREEITPPKPLVEGLINFGEVALFVAPQKQGKSLFSQQLAHAVATGTTLMGTWPVSEPHSVLYIAMEGSRYEWQRRTRKLIGLTGVDATPNLHFEFCSAMYVNTEKGRDEFMGVLDECKEADGKYPDLIIPDPWYHSHQGEMMTSHGVQPTIQFFKAVMELTKCALWIPHHMPKPTVNMFGQRNQGGSGDSWGYGSASLGWWIDVEYDIKANKRKRESVLTCPFSRTDERIPEAEGDGLSLQYISTEDKQGFNVGVSSMLEWMLGDLNGRTLKDVAAELEMSERQVRNGLKGLENQGKVVIVGGARGRGNAATIAVREEI